MRAWYSPQSHVMAARAVGTAIVSSRRASCRITASFSAAAGVCSSRLSTMTASATTCSLRFDSRRIRLAMQLSSTAGICVAQRPIAWIVARTKRLSSCLT
jgi:hypothetical protein